VTAAPLPTIGRSRDAEAIRGYLVDQLNIAVRRPATLGGEPALLVLGDILGYAEGSHEEWRNDLRELRPRGLANAGGVQGAFATFLPGPHYHDDAVGSVYAEIAHRRRWLRPDRILHPSEYAQLLDRVHLLVTRDHTARELLSLLGPPSVRCGEPAPAAPQTLMYLVNRPEQPAVALHLWNGGQPTLFPEPILLAVRTGLGPLRDTLLFTPEGRVRCAP
jgi:hypothetical protein